MWLTCVAVVVVVVPPTLISCQTRANADARTQARSMSEHQCNHKMQRIILRATIWPEDTSHAPRTHTHIKGLQSERMTAATRVTLCYVNACAHKQRHLCAGKTLPAARARYLRHSVRRNVQQFVRVSVKHELVPGQTARKKGVNLCVHPAHKNSHRFE